MDQPANALKGASPPRRVTQKRSGKTPRLTPTIDKTGLAVVLQAIQEDAGVAQAFIDAAQHGSMFTASRTALLRWRELRMCVGRQGWPLDGRTVDGALHARVAEHLRKPRSILHVVRGLRNDLAIEQVTLQFAVEIRGLSPMEDVKLAGFRFGTLAHVWPDFNPGKLLGKPNESTQCTAVAFEVRVPKGNDGLELAWSRADEAVDRLAVSYLRRWEETGSPQGLAVGPRAWRRFISGANPYASYNQPWLEGTDYGVVRDWLEARTRPNPPPQVKAKGLPRFRTRIDGYANLPPGELKDDFEAAFAAIGRAVRLIRSGPASVALAWSAYERAYNFDSSFRAGRSARILATALLLASASKGTFEHPGGLVGAYSLRNKAVHTAHPLLWRERGAQDTLGRIYRQVEALLEFCLDNGFSTHADIRKALTQPEAREEALPWAIGERDALVEQRLEAVLPAYQRQLDRTIALWDVAIRLIQPAQQGPKRRRPKQGSA